MRKRWIAIGAVALALGCGAPQVSDTYVPAVDEPTPSAEPSVALEPEVEPADVYYANCEEVRKDHPNGLRAGDPGYRLKLDRDKDGKACDG